METHHLLTTAPDQIRGPAVATVASSVLQNVFGAQRSGEIDQAAFAAPVPSIDGLTEDTILERLESRKKQAAIALGIAAEEVQGLPFDLSALESEGIFLNIDCRGFGALVRQLEWKTLGIRLPENAAIRVSPPRAGLLPDIFRNKLMRGPAQAHAALHKYGFRFTLCETVWGTSDYKWIPWNAFGQFEHDYNRACETLEDAKIEVIEKYDEIHASLVESFRQLANDSAGRFEATIEGPFDRAEFVDAVIAQAVGMVPSRETIRDGLNITMKPKVMILGSELAAERQLTRDLALKTVQTDAARRAVEVDLESKQKIADLRVADFEDDRQREREVRERIRNMKLEAARNEAEQAVSPLREGLSQITGRIFDAATEMAEKLRDADFVPGALAKRARQMCEWYTLMNFTGDTALENVLTALNDAAVRDSKTRSPAEMRSALGDVLRATTVQSRRLLDDDRLSALEM